MAEERRKTNKERIKEIQTQIISNSKDAHFTKNLIQQLSGLYQMDKLIDIPLKDIKDSIDFGACELHKVKDGYVFIAKGGLYTFVDLRMQSICTMLQTLFDLHNKDDKTEDENIIYENFRDAVLYIFQAPIFASMNEKSLFEIATAILKTFNDYAEEHYTNSEAVEETENDIKANNEAENAAKAMEILAESPLPPEDLG